MLKSVSAEAPTQPTRPGQHGITRNASRANFASIGLILLSVGLGAVGQLALKAAVNSMGGLELSFQILLDLASNPLLLVALAIYGLSAAFWLLALMRADLSFVYPFLSLTFVAVLIGGAVLFNEHISALRLAGFVVVIAGLLIVTRGEHIAARKRETPE